ncbi:hypothetical protein MAR_014664 [Mya arenaria]|uniref:Uncharacterized protein n=1 Tax=Mya arenaria TaxID=6604 RepID=A0ABY7FER7_MYAAR|nr:hypothetical protein MAR_014664 [Mya arenaria]
MCGRCLLGISSSVEPSFFPVKVPRRFMNLTCFTDRQFYNFQQLYLVPTVLEVWKDKQSCILVEVRTSGRVVSVAADGRCCSPGHTAKYLSYTLLDIVLRKALLKGIQKLSPEGQTSGLEGFHSLVCGFATKNLHFHHAQMAVRMLIAAMHWNENSSRAQQKTKDGRQMFKISFPKGRKQDGVTSAVKEKQTYDYVSTLLAALLKLRQTRETHAKARLERN